MYIVARSAFDALVSLCPCVGIIIEQTLVEANSAIYKESITVTCCSLHATWIRSSCCQRHLTTVTDAAFLLVALAK